MTSRPTGANPAAAEGSGVGRGRWAGGAGGRARPGARQPAGRGRRGGHGPRPRGRAPSPRGGSEGGWRLGEGVRPGLWEQQALRPPPPVKNITGSWK